MNDSTVLSFRVENGKLKGTSRPLPKLRPEWALVRVRLAGICNTDVEIMRGYHGFRGTLRHEFVGEVADVHAVSGTVRKNGWGGGSAARSTFLAARIASSPFAISAAAD